MSSSGPSAHGTTSTRTDDPDLRPPGTVRTDPPQDGSATESRLGISPAQVAGSALAAASAAFASSFLGVAGTVIGAAVVSIVATVGSAMYTASLRRSGAAVRRTAETVRNRDFRPLRNRSGDLIGFASSDGEAGKAPDQPGSIPASSTASSPPWEVWRTRLSGLPWPKLALASLAVLVVTLGAITLLELGTGRTVSSMLGGSQDGGTTLGHSVGADHSTVRTSTPTPAPAQTPTGGTGSQDTGQGSSTTTPAPQPTGPKATVGNTPTPQPTSSATAPPPTQQPTTGSGSKVTGGSIPTSAPTGAGTSTP